MAKDQAPSVTNWENLIEAFVESRSDSRGITLRDLKTRMRRVLVRPKSGHYALPPKQLDLLTSLKSMEGKESKTIDITSVIKVPDTIHEGKEVENYQTS